PSALIPSLPPAHSAPRDLPSFPTRRSSDLGLNTGLHPDFGSGTYAGGPIGIPYTTVPGDQKKVSVKFGFAGVSELDAHLLLIAGDRKSTRLNSSHRTISYAVFCLKKKTHKT